MRVAAAVATTTTVAFRQQNGNLSVNELVSVSTCVSKWVHVSVCVWICNEKLKFASSILEELNI